MGAMKQFNSKQGRWVARTARTVRPRASNSSYQYVSDGGFVNKATIEHIYAPDYEEVDGTESDIIWKMGWQMHERNLVWSDDLKLRLIKRIAAEECHIEEEEMDSRLAVLLTLLPGLEAKLASAPPKMIAKMAADPSNVASRLLRMKEIFPDADLSKMVNGRLSLLLDDDLSLDEISEAADALRESLPSIKTDVFASLFPQVLDKEDFLMAVEDFKRIMPDRDLALQLRTEPSLILQLMKGKNLIPYDQVSNPFVSGRPQKID